MKPELGIVGHETRQKHGFTVLTIDTRKASYQGIKWNTLSEFGRRKFENFVVITRAPERVKCLYWC